MKPNQSLKLTPIKDTKTPHYPTKPKGRAAIKGFAIAFGITALLSLQGCGEDCGGLRMSGDIQPPQNVRLSGAQPIIAPQNTIIPDGPKPPEPNAPVKPPNTQEIRLSGELPPTR